jgi:prepilin-type N-terminal cleavage/methylation domain-containing protein/prepilin-type processing-associated H-X9-DG protein
MPLVPKKSPRGFALVELLVVLALFCFLLGILLPAVQKANDAANRIQCTNNLRQLAIAMHNMNDAYRKMPAVVGTFPAGSKNVGTVHFYALPFLEQDQIYKASAGGQGNFLVWMADTWAKRIQTFICPADDSAPPKGVYKGLLATTNYAANWLVFGKKGASIPQSFPDGTSNTIMFAERYQVCGQDPCAWGYPELYSWAPMFGYSSLAKFQIDPPQETCDAALAQAFHQGGMNVAMGDGSSRLVSTKISPQTWAYAVTPDDGQPLGADW